MSRDKQIEEMANEIMTVIMRNRNMLGVAETLYEAGYRKQSESFSRPHENDGEWMSVEDRLPEKGGLYPRLYYTKFVRSRHIPTVRRRGYAGWMLVGAARLCYPLDAASRASKDETKLN